MPRHITPRTTLEILKREAKRWLRALRTNAGDAGTEARVRLDRATPNAPKPPTLRDVQHALALEHGFEGWTALKAHLVAVRAAATATTAAGDEVSHERRVSWFLETACPDHHVRGAPAHVRARHAAMRLLERYPGLAHDSLVTAVVCGDLAGVKQRLAITPHAAVEANAAPGPDRSGGGQDEDQFKDLGPKHWEPLLFLCFTRLPLDSANDNAVVIARALLDHGANPNGHFMAGDSRYTPLVGVIGEGEEDRPPHPRRDELVRLLLAHGAEPYDGQVLYNIHFRGNVLWWLELVYEESLKRGRRSDWDDPNWEMLGMGGYGPGAHYLLGIAVGKNDLELAEWLLSHGASPNLPAETPSTHPKFKPNESMYEMATRAGHTEMADLLVRYGATPTAVTLSGIESFTVAVFRLDRAAAAAMVAEHPEYAQSTAPIFAAARTDRADVVELLLDLGTSPNVEDKTRQRALHVAAYANSLKVATLLIARGAEIDPVESNWGNTPLGAAVYAGHGEMIDLLVPLSRDIWEVNYVGRIDRLHELLRSDPVRARAVTQKNQTLLMWLPPDDETHAVEAARLLIANGADPSLKNNDGQTAADRAERLGMFTVVELLRAAGGAAPSGPAPGSLTEADYEIRAEALLQAYRTGTPEAMARHWGLTWHRRAWATMQSYVQLDLGKHRDPGGADIDITLDEARFLVAREHGFENWKALREYVAASPRNRHVTAKPMALVTVDDKGDARPAAWLRDWDAAIAQIAGEQFAGLDARGQMTDAMLDRIHGFEHITVLRLGGSRGVTDAGLRALERMPRLREVDLSGCAITDRGLDVLRGLPELTSVSLAWTRVTDAGVAPLSRCDRLERVDLMGTATGDRTLAALADKAALRVLKTGNHVTDAGLPLLHEFPAFASWKGGDTSSSLLSYDGGPTHLTLRGPFTDAGLSTLVGLDGLAALNLDDSALAITPAGLAPLAMLANLGWLAVDATDESMPYIAAMPRLRFLGCQDTVAGDDGFVALSRSLTIEKIWGRRCHNLRTRGFTALSTMPALRSLSVSCLNVGDEGIATLPLFPSLRELMPMDIPDRGFRHIGRCEKLESLILMYCRDTGDRATEHIAGLRTLKKYFASYNRITDRSLEILSTMDSLEEVELSAIAGITDGGVAKLGRLPRLRELRLSGLQLTRPKPGVFPLGVNVVFEL